MRLALFLPLTALAACGGSEARPVEATATEETAPEVAAREEPLERAPAEDAPPAAEGEPIPGGPCETAADCGWDDPCAPTACVASPPTGALCTETALPPGVCECFRGRCALRPGEERPPSADADACEGYGERACGLDVARGRCEVGRTDDLAGGGPRWTGPRCYCDGRPPRRCRLTWIEPVACEETADCWVELEPVPHPIARPRRMRRRAFRPCHDGELAPACEDGACTLVGYGC